MAREDWRGRRIEGLLAHPDMETRHRMERAYNTNPSFHHGINLLENSIPFLVEALFKSAEDTEARVRLMAEADLLGLHPLRNFPTS